MSVTESRTAVEHYAARVDAVLAQRTRLRGMHPGGDLFGGLPVDHPILKSDPLRPLDPNLEVIASQIKSDDVVVDVGGGAGRVSLPLALRCREVINVEPSESMGAGFISNAERAGIDNVRIVTGDWLEVDSPEGTVALVNHVTYLTREIVPFIKKLEEACSRRVIITGNSPPPPFWNSELYRLLHGEEEEMVPGHVELVNVLWELGILPDIYVLPLPVASPVVTESTREAAVQGAIGRFLGDQWSFWPLADEHHQCIREVLESRFDELFTTCSRGFTPRWITPGREILITWQPSIR
ncbi:MAG: class I SAM-dependent methyltransferase [Desulfobulbaceae bacterium]|nr:class I SAM-dependent methyltransferase [Desulfobulbaceae bacterium]